MPRSPSHKSLLHNLGLIGDIFKSQMAVYRGADTAICVLDNIPNILNSSEIIFIQVTLYRFRDKVLRMPRGIRH